MNLKELHTTIKPVSVSPIFKRDLGNAISLHILKGEQLKEHITKTPAVLICVFGEVVYGTENGIKETLKPGDYILIEPMIKHWVDGVEDKILCL
jgi:quercetin dioxygenase-like cupin family protein